MTRHAALLVTSLLCSTAPSAFAATSSCNDVFPDRAAAAAFVSQWAADWNRIDIAAVVAHLSDDARMRSPLATRLTGDPVVTGRDAIARYWHSAYGSLSEPNLQVDSFAWDPAICRLNVWWTADTGSGPTRASEFMDFTADGLIHYGEAFYGQ